MLLEVCVDSLASRALPLLAGRTVWNCAVHCWPVG